MKAKIAIGVLAILLIVIVIGIAIISIINKDDNSTSTITSNPTTPFMMVCTPPLCAIGTSETYFCPGNCPGGCGTTCATYTPTP